MPRRFAQVDVFTRVPMRGNPLAVVVDAAGLSDDEMARFANWTNLSETTFLLPPTDDRADYRVRIFTTTRELPFAGHPTLGSCRVWLDQGGAARGGDTIVQECGIGLVTVRSAGPRLAFAAPPLMRSGPLDPELLDAIQAAIGVEAVDAAWADNGPGWVAVEVADAEVVRGLSPDLGDLPDLKLGIVGRASGDERGSVDFDVEVRAFFPGTNGHDEDPVTGSLNASIAVWMMGRDPSLERYVARQGTALGRDGRVHLTKDGDGTIWVEGDTVNLITGTVDL